MVEKFHRELDQLRKEVIKMGELAEDMLQQSVEALKKQDNKLAEWVLSNKCKIADMDQDIETKTLQMLTLYQPMAKDLREIGCIFKMITYLARIGRYAKDIAKISIEISDRSHFKKLISIPHMSQIVCGMIDDALVSFKEKDISRLENFSDRDNDVDELRYSIFRECLTYMMEDPKVITQGTHYIMIARYLERCADHACKIAEKIYYMVKGKHIDIDPSPKKCNVK
jgi:phosphate transport system protein